MSALASPVPRPGTLPRPAPALADEWDDRDYWAGPPAPPPPGRYRAPAPRPPAPAPPPALPASPPSLVTPSGVDLTDAVAAMDALPPRRLAIAEEWHDD